MDCCRGKMDNLHESNFAVGDVDVLRSILKKYEGKKGSLISILQDVQAHYNYLPLEALNFISMEAGIKPAKIHGVATFYTQFRLKPIGENLIMLCQGTACHVNGSKTIQEAINQELNIKEGETTEDNLFTLINVACLGCCSLSPVMMINDETYGKLTGDKAKSIIREIKAKSQTKGA